MINYTLAINMAMTIDGKVERPDGKWYGLSSKNDKAKMDFYRSQYEVLILGKNSIINDNPVIHLRYTTGNEPLPLILIRKGTLSPKLKVFQHARKTPLIITTEECFDVISKDLKDFATIKVLGKNNISPVDVVQYLGSLGYTKYLLEGGPSLNSIFFENNLVTTIYLTIVPYLIGEKKLSGIISGNTALPNFEMKSWKLESIEQIQDEIFLKYIKLI
jgi:2,5-diamino-6-(ribosylamino)-4(3H)-pyrimidinone 5'-phosphate reductase